MKTIENFKMLICTPVIFETSVYATDKAKLDVFNLLSWSLVYFASPMTKFYISMCKTAIELMHCKMNTLVCS